MAHYAGPFLLVFILLNQTDDDLRNSVIGERVWGPEKPFVVILFLSNEFDFSTLNCYYPFYAYLLFILLLEFLHHMKITYLIKLKVQILQQLFYLTNRFFDFYLSFSIKFNIL